MNSRIILFFIYVLLVSSCDKEHTIPDCLNANKVWLLERINSGNVSCVDTAYINEYIFQNEYVYLIPSLCTGFISADDGFVLNQECDTLVLIGAAIEDLINGEKFSEKAEFQRRVWSHPD